MYRIKAPPVLYVSFYGDSLCKVGVNVTQVLALTLSLVVEYIMFFFDSIL